jgi:hypothetical protein
MTCLHNRLQMEARIQTGWLADGYRVGSRATLSSAAMLCKAGDSGPTWDYFKRHLWWLTSLLSLILSSDKPEFASSVLYLLIQNLGNAYESLQSSRVFFYANSEEGQSTKGLTVCKGFIKSLECRFVNSLSSFLHIPLFSYLQMEGLHSRRILFDTKTIRWTNEISQTHLHRLNFFPKPSLLFCDL